MKQNRLLLLVVLLLAIQLIGSQVSNQIFYNYAGKRIELTRQRMIEDGVPPNVRGNVISGLEGLQSSVSSYVSNSVFLQSMFSFVMMMLIVFAARKDE